MSWFKVNLTCDKNFAYLIEEILVAHDAISISMINDSINNPIYEPKVGENPLWNKISLTALFEEIISKKMILSFLKGIPYSNLTIRKLNNQNWIEKYQKTSKPIRISETLWITPSWDKKSIPTGSNRVIIDPGLGFGSGTHETTSMILELLDKELLMRKTVIDYGCGSGILGITAHILGAKEIIFHDIDNQAISSTRENCKLNAIDSFKIFTNSTKINENYADLLLANIFSNTLIDLKDDFYRVLKNESKLILSGIMKKQLNSVIESFNEIFTLKDIKQKNDWYLLEYRK